MRWLSAVLLVAACGGQRDDTADLVGAWTLTATVSGARYAVAMERSPLCEQIALRTSVGRACADYDGTLTPLHDLCLAAPCAPSIPAGTHFDPDAGFFRGTIVQGGARVPATLRRITPP